jgi:hypothetical protein
MLICSSVSWLVARVRVTKHIPSSFISALSLSVSLSIRLSVCRVQSCPLGHCPLDTLCMAPILTARVRDSISARQTHPQVSVWTCLQCVALDLKQILDLSHLKARNLWHFCTPKKLLVNTARLHRIGGPGLGVILWLSGCPRCEACNESYLINIVSLLQRTYFTENDNLRVCIEYYFLKYTSEIVIIY